MLINNHNEMITKKKTHTNKLDATATKTK